MPSDTPGPFTPRPPAGAGPDRPPLLVKNREAARLFSTTERTLFAWRTARCPHLKFGAVVMYAPADVLAWLTATFGVGGQQQHPNTEPTPAGGHHE